MELYNNCIYNKVQQTLFNNWVNQGNDHLGNTYFWGCKDFQKQHGKWIPEKKKERVVLQISAFGPYPSAVYAKVPFCVKFYTTYTVFINIYVFININTIYMYISTIVLFSKIQIYTINALISADS